MLDIVFRPHVDPLLNKWAQRVLQSGLTANKLTLIGLVFGLAASFAVGMQVYMLGLVLILLNRLFDGLAGAVAKVAGVTALGSYLDFFCDFFVLGSFVFLFSLGLPGSGTAAAFLLFSYLVMAVAYLAMTTFLPRANILETPRSGLVENTELTVFMILCCAYPPAFPAFAALFGLLCLATAILRLAGAVKALQLT